MSKVTAYLRVSTDKQDVANQWHGISEYVSLKMPKVHLDTVETVEDVVSGRKDWRLRAIGRLIEESCKGDVIVVSEVSRLARSTLQVLEIFQECVKKGVIVHVVKNRMTMDDSLTSKITVIVLGLAAEIEREFISQRTTEALAKRKADGKHVGRPVGAKNRIKKLDERGAEIRDLLKLGVSKISIMKIVGCAPETFYKWLGDNGLQRYIKTSEGKEKVLQEN